MLQPQSRPSPSGECCSIPGRTAAAVIEPRVEVCAAFPWRPAACAGPVAVEWIGRQGAHRARVLRGVLAQPDDTVLFRTLAHGEDAGRAGDPAGGALSVCVFLP